MPEPLTLTREQARRIDVTATSEFGVPSLVLMENAGRGVVDVLLAADPPLTAPTPPLAGPPRGPGPKGADLRRSGEEATQRDAKVAILCGKGNNAGDGFVIARHLAIQGVAAQVILLVPPEQLAGDALTAYGMLLHAGVPMADLSAVGVAALDESLSRHADGAGWIVDAMLGTGAHGAPREPIATAIRWMNARRAKRLAVDLPSGLDCDTGVAAAHTVRADLTCTFAAAKAGFAAPASSAFLGQVHVVSIGLTSSMVRRALQG